MWTAEENIKETFSIFSVPSGFLLYVKEDIIVLNFKKFLSLFSKMAIFEDFGKGQ